VLSDLNNIERISETLDADYHVLHHFISDSSWDARAVMDKVAKDVSGSLPKDTLTGLLIDESGLVKKGNKSVGVGHQYCGNVGKTANSQVAVFGCLCNGKYASLVDSRQYLPVSWTSDVARCSEAGIPEKERVFKTKQELAVDIIKHQLSMGIVFDFVGADGLYGNDAAFAREIDKLGLVYMLDIHSDQQIYMEEPELRIPERKTAKGPAPKKLKASSEPIAVCKYIGALEPSQWKTIDIRQSAKGMAEMASNSIVEQGYLMDLKHDYSATTGIYEYTYMTDDDKYEIDFQEYIGNGETIDAGIHTHTCKGAPIFSAQDIYSIRDLDKNCKISNLSSFAWFLTTGNEQSAYFVAIENPTAFREFCDTKINTDAKKRDIDVAVRDAYREGKDWMATFLTKFSGSGMALFKAANGDYSKWTQLSLNGSMQIQTINCPE
jgi:hypothetical protein